LNRLGSSNGAGHLQIPLMASQRALEQQLFGQDFVGAGVGSGVGAGVGALVGQQLV